jgi:hypothetical protein
VALLVASACGGASNSAELEALREEVESLKVATTVATTTTSAPTTTTTIPGPRWDLDASFEENTKMLVGAPIDPLFEDAIEDFNRALTGMSGDHSVRERYWANYISSAEIVCRTLEQLWDQGVDENWNTRKAASQLRYYEEAAISLVQSMEGFGSLSEEEATAISAAAMLVNSCWYIFQDFYDFVND